MNARTLRAILALACTPASAAAIVPPSPAPTRAAASGTPALRCAAIACTAGRTDNDLSSLDPEFRARLERVISRLTGEMGHTVEVLETYRDQGRQEVLYAQGRSAPGPVVTWTRNSLHTLGRAADLRVDGGFSDGPGYRDLRRVAEAEGLHTLGAKDPGHVELPRVDGEQHLAWYAPAGAEVRAATAMPSIMTRIVVTGRGEESAPVATTIFASRHAVLRDAAPEEPPEDAPGPPPVAPSAVASRTDDEPPRVRVPNAAERRRAARTAAEGGRAATLSADGSDAARVGRSTDLQDGTASSTTP